MKKWIFLGLSLWFGSVFAQDAVSKRLDSLTSEYEQNGYHGVILVAKGDKILFQKPYGYANFEKKIKHTNETLFKSESVGKMFTAVSVMQLVEKGKLSLDQTVKELLPRLQLKNADKITVHHLLTHTSGMQSPWDHPDWKFKKVYTRDEMIKIITEVPPVFDNPGKEMFYSNSGYTVLGWIIEAVTGKDFDEYFQENIFTPLGMNGLRHLNDTLMPVENGAQPYRILSSSKYIYMGETVGPRASPAGGWITTAMDLYKFMAALYSNKLLKPSTLELMKTANNTKPKDSSYRFYAYGLETFVNLWMPDVFIMGHNGGGAGFSVDAYLEANTGTIIISCTNLYHNSRPIAANYFKAALGRNILPVEGQVSVKIYDLIEKKGIDEFIANEKENFALLNVKPEVRLFANISDAMETAKDFKTMTKWLELGRKYFPEEGFIYVLSGDSYMKIGNKQDAKKMYETAKELGTKKKDERLLQAVTQKLGQL